MFDEICTVIIDNGSGMIKAGKNNGDSPDYTFPSVVGEVPRFAPYEKGMNIYIGDKAYNKVGTIVLRYPIEHGIVTNWDDMEKIWHHIFYYKLKIDPSEHPILMTDASKNPAYHREKMIQILFETFNVPFFFVCSQAPLSLYALGRTTGITCDIGDGLIQVVPQYQGYVFNKAIKRVNFGGRDLTAYLQKMLNERDYSFRTEGEKLIVCDAKEKESYVAIDYEAELEYYKSSSIMNVPFTLCDGKKITLSDERFRCPELLFKPYMNYFEHDGIDKMIHDSIMDCNIGARKDLFSNIVLSGGSSMFKGLPERIEKEIKNIAPLKAKINVVAEPERQNQVWNGGCVLTTIKEFPQMVISHSEYNDTGYHIVHSKCSL